MDKFENMNFENNDTNNVPAFEGNKTEPQNTVNEVNEASFADVPDTSAVDEQKPVTPSQQYTPWENSSYIREYSPVSENVREEAPAQYDFSPVSEDVNASPVIETPFAENTEEPVRLINETVKKSGLKKYVAIAVAAHGKHPK